MADGVKGGGGWMRWLLVVSLALNLLVLGGLAGGLYQGHVRIGQPERMGGSLSRALAEEDRRAILSQMRSTREERGGGQAEVMAQIAAALRVPDFDRALLEQRMSAQRAVFAQRMEFGQGLLLDRLQRMSPSERAAVADRLDESLQRKKR